MNEPAPATPAPRRWSLLRLIGALALLLVAALAGALVLADTSLGHRFIADRIAALRPANGLRYSVGRINGSIWTRATLIDVRVRDPKGLVLAVPRAELDWRPLAWLDNRLDITALDIPAATLAKLPEPVATGDRKSTRLNSSHVRTSRMPSSA